MKFGLRRFELRRKASNLWSANFLACNETSLALLASQMNFNRVMLSIYGLKTFLPVLKPFCL